MKFWIEKQSGRRIDVQPAFTEVGGSRIISSTKWMDLDGVGHDVHQVITVRDGKIVDMQDCNSRREAERFAGTSS